MAENPALRAALELARLGYPVLPLKPGEKVPAVQGGYRSASTDPSAIVRWWRAIPTANVGIATGELLVLDLDAPLGLGWPDGGPLHQELQARAGALVRSPRGGLHLYFSCPEQVEVRCSAGQLGAGVDVRAAGGHIVAPPSGTAHGLYRWLRQPPPKDALPQPPTWLVERLAALARPRGGPLSVNGVTGEAAVNGQACMAVEVMEGIPEGRRKVTLVRLAGVLRDKGLSLHAIEAALKAENAHRCRPPLPDAEVEDVLRSAARWRPGDFPAPQAARKLVPVRAAEIQPEPVKWLWPRRVPIGGITLLVGRPGAGKGIFCADLAARVSRGAAAPDGEQIAPGEVLIISAEDHRAAVLRPRLDAAAADCARIHILSETFDLGDWPALDELCEKIGPGLRLVVIDPVGSFMPAGRDSFRDNEVRSTLAPLAALAAERGFAAVVVAHTRKAEAVYADDLALGSRAFVGIARAVHHLVEETEENRPTGRRLLLPGKTNLSRRPPGLAFRVFGDPPRAEWESQPLPEWFTADLALGARTKEKEAARGRPPKELEEAKLFIQELLADGPKPVAELRKECTAAGLAWRTVHRAADELGVRRERTGSQSYLWLLPNQDLPRPDTPEEGVLFQEENPENAH